MLKRAGKELHPTIQPPASWSCPTQSPGDTFPQPHISCVCWLTRLRCPLDSGLGAPSSQELLTAWGAALLGVLRAPPGHVGAMPRCTSQVDSGADVTGRVTAALGGDPAVLHPLGWEGSDPPGVTSSSLLPPCQHQDHWCATSHPIRSHPRDPAQPRAPEQRLPQIAHKARPLVLLAVGWG